jgi:hypothetical protein
MALGRAATKHNKRKALIINELHQTKRETKYTIQQTFNYHFYQNFMTTTEQIKDLLKRREALWSCL